jgi:cation transport ATPase
MATLPPFEFSIKYVLYILAVTMTSLLMIIIGGWVKERFQKKGLRFQFANKSKFRKKFWGFILFIVAIFLLGWMGERLQNAVYNYLLKNAATTITGIIVAILITWFLYDWLVWRKNQD